MAIVFWYTTEFKFPVMYQGAVTDRGISRVRLGLNGPESPFRTAKLPFLGRSVAFSGFRCKGVQYLEKIAKNGPVNCIFCPAWSTTRPIFIPQSFRV